ncbi:probable LRR receptor-like serine/threonine-protein kinase At3g47570 [Miscanthus floridulus]|uniref:probable LRR receptor-like serine/threonine-protein kinase At3g47570 n=1 Tax=Miscanthus floridulus TaxID=154761 RepID=UPI0034588F40
MCTKAICAIMPSVCLLLLSASMLVSTLVTAEGDEEEAALLAFKATAISNGHNDPLASWNRSATGGYCSWEGVRCRGTRHRRVVALSLPSYGLTGVLSPAIGNLSSLRTLDLSSNGFSGNIPASLGRLRHLHTLNLTRNAFSGLLPANLSSCTSLMKIVLDFNKLSGNMPSELGDKLKQLKVLCLANNSFTGRIPASLANLTSLRILNLAFNLLEGTIPNSLGVLKDLSFLALAFNNLSGEPPISLYNLSSLEMLQIQSNMLSGSIPTDIGSRFPSMRILSLSTNQFTGTIPASLSNLTSLQELHLAMNMLSGYVPRTIGRLRALQMLDLYNNMLQANDWEGWEFITALSNCSQLQQLALNGNTDFAGHLPYSLVNLSTSLQSLWLDNTGIWGSIPSAIGNLVGLEILVIFDTSISGEIPDSIGKLANLTKLGLFNTNLSGQIPSSVGNLTKLAILYAYHANLEGPIPSSIGKSKSLIALDLSRNRLSGSIPMEIFKPPLLSFIYLDLSYNSLSGPLPSQVGSLVNLDTLALSGNQLSGKIPESIGECIVLQVLKLDSNLFNGSIPQYLNKGLIILNLSVNKLSGTIPDAIGSISALEQLCLAYNNFSGPIPAVLQNLTSLSKFDLSFNDLQGEVPEEGIFRNLVNLLIIGNNKLCGGVPQLHLVPCKTDSVKKNIRGKLKYLKIALPATFALLLLAIVIALLIYRKQRRKQKGALEPSMVEERYERVSYHALSNGTNGFSEANLLGKGSFGTVYKCVFQAEGTVVAVKVFDLEQSGSTRSFVAECEALRRVRHRCLMKIITCCSSINEQGQDFKALVFEFMPNGSLNRWLHMESGMPTLNNTLSLAQRLDIAVDIMDALDYLHNHCQSPIIHCDLKPSNILLAEDMSARVGDFGISRIISESESMILQNSNSTIGIRGSIGYVAPEYGEGSSITTFGDVYSLGILLLEIFTGRSPTDDMFRGSMDLHKFSEDALPDKIWEIADTTMWLHTGTYDSNTRNIIEKCLIHVISLGVSCSRKQPRERTLIQDAVNEMHAIRDSYLKFARTLVVQGVGTIFL